MTTNKSHPQVMDNTPIGQQLALQARRRPGAIALLEPGLEPMSYADLAATVTGLKKQLRKAGIGPGHRVALAMPNSSATAAVILALLDSCTLVPLNPDYRQREFESLYRRTGIDALLTSLPENHACRVSADNLDIPCFLLAPGLQQAGTFTMEPTATGPAVQSSRRSAQNPAALVLHTSGSTSAPKIVPLYHDNLQASIKNLVASLALVEQDRCLNMMPMFHIGAILDLMLASISVGASMIAPAANNAETFFQCLHDYQPSWYQAVPTMLRDIINGLNAQPSQPGRKSSLRLVRSVSSALPNRLLHEVEELLDTTVIEIYGMTESAGVICSNPLQPGSQKQGSVGLPQGCDVKIVDSRGKPVANGERGEVLVRGPNLMPAYEGPEDQHDQGFGDGFFRTGDEAYFDKDGYLFLCGRIKEIINRGGEKISPLEIDRIAETHHSVQAAAAFALPHTSLGEEVGLAVIPADRENFDETGFLEFLGSNLAAHKLPRRIYYPDRLPRAAGGKLRRYLLAQEAAQAPGSSSKPAWVEPRSALAIDLATIWKNAIDIEQVGMQDNFFDLGGDSLGAAVVVAELRKRFPNISASILYEYPGLQELEQQLLAQDPADGRGEEQLVPAAEIDNIMQPFMSAWQGTRLEQGSLLVGRNCDGIRTPLFWCVNGYSEFDALAELLDSDQPVYGMRSLYDTGFKSDGATLRLANMYCDELRRIQPRGPYLVGGFCEGGKIAFMMAQMLRDSGETVASLMLQEQFVASDYSGRVAIFICRPGRNNPYFNFADATRGWRKFYSGDIQLYRMNGRHKDVYQQPDVELLSRQLQREMRAALDYRHDDTRDQCNQLQRLPLDAYQAQLNASPPKKVMPGSKFTVDVEVTNRSSFDWMPTSMSGLVLGAKWIKASGETRQWMAGVSDLPRALHPGDSITIPLTVKAPFRFKKHFLELDLVDDGVSWFTDMGSQPSRHQVDLKLL